MIYVENDFYSNFSSAVSADDDLAIQKMMVDQISTIIAKRRGEVIITLQKSGITTTKNPSNEELANLIVSHLKKNKKLRVGIAYLIAKQNGILEVSDKSKRKSDKDDQKVQSRSSDINQTADVVASIANTITILAESLTGSRGSDFKTELQNQTNVKAPNYSGQTYGQKEVNTVRKKKKNRKKLIIFLGLVAVAGVAYYGYKKGWFSKNIKEGGGDVGTPNSGMSELS